MSEATLRLTGLVVLLALAMVGSLYIERSTLPANFFKNRKLPKGRGLVNEIGLKQLLRCDGSADERSLAVCLLESFRAIISRYKTNNTEIAAPGDLSQALLDTIGIQEMEWLERTTSEAARLSPSETRKSCHPDCSERGNCNIELGVCECPFGFEGDACEVDLLSHCRIKPGVPASCGPVSLKSCSCMQQCLHYSKMKNHEIDVQNSNIKCFTRNNSEVYYDPPSPDERNVSYHIMDNTGQLIRTLEPEEALQRRNDITKPLNACPQQCYGRGACIQWADNPDLGAKCFCYRGFAGEACELQKDDACFANCLGRGNCVNGFCHCQPGYFGIGCHRDAALYAPNSDRIPSQVSLKIYIYNLPSYLAHLHIHYAGFQSHDPNYIAYDKFLNNLLESPFLAQNPNEANLFYIPALSYEMTSNVGNPSQHLSRVIDYVKHQFPYWNNSGGLDHLIWTSGDRGGCHINTIEALAPIQLTHFGLVKALDGATHPCFNTSKDIVTPPYLLNGMKDALETYQDYLDVVESQNKSTLLFFAGGIRKGDPSYSGLARQILLNESLHWDNSTFDINEGSVDNYIDRYKNSVFCFAPYGYGYGMRLSLAMVHGCIPLIIQDHVVQPFQDVLPYQDFSITLSNDDIKNLPQILSKISPEEIHHLRQGLVTFWPAFVYETYPTSRFSPFSLTMHSLKKRYLSLKSKILQ